jgi:pyruvate/2-oxoglutarate dehydrogenase complex dihydrolipoamide acyltransferase (E2) component
MKLDRTKPFGKVSPPMSVPGCEMPAHYEQDNILFDSQDRPVDKKLWDDEDDVAPAAPAPKAAAAPAPGKVKGTPKTPAPAGKKAAAAAPANQTAAAGTGIDLAAWGRGQADFLSQEIFKAVRSKYNVVLSERRDVVDLLITEKVITAEEARKDV